MFVSMCKQKSMPRVVLGTTMWSEVAMAVGERRENELSDMFDMVAKGYPKARFEHSHQSAWDILGKLETHQYPSDKLSVSSAFSEES